MKPRQRQKGLWIKLITYTVITALFCQNAVWASPAARCQTEEKLAARSLFTWVDAHSEDNAGAVAQKKIKSETLDRFLKAGKTNGFVFNTKNQGRFPLLGEIEEAIKGFFEIPDGERFNYNKTNNIATINTIVDGHNAKLTFFKNPESVKVDPKIGLAQKDLPTVKQRLYWFERDLRSEVRSVIFRHQDGFVIVPTMLALMKKGALEIFGDNKDVSLSEFVKRYGGNEGYIGVALNLLAAQGWLEVTEEGEMPRYKVTPKGSIAFEMAESLMVLDSFMVTAWLMDCYLFDMNSPAPMPTADRIKDLIDMAGREWELPKETDPIRKDVRNQLRRHIDGMLVGPVMVSLGMRSIFEKFHPETKSLDISAIKLIGTWIFP